MTFAPAGGTPFLGSKDPLKLTPVPSGPVVPESYVETDAYGSLPPENDAHLGS